MRQKVNGKLMTSFSQKRLKFLSAVIGLVNSPMLQVYVLVQDAVL
jgi:hypothetical protein